MYSGGPFVIVSLHQLLSPQRLGGRPHVAVSAVAGGDSALHEEIDTKPAART